MNPAQWDYQWSLAEANLHVLLDEACRRYGWSVSVWRTPRRLEGLPTVYDGRPR